MRTQAEADDLLALELHGTLLSEFGARAIYGDLARSCRDAELARLLEHLREEQDEQVRELREVMRSLGLRPPESSTRRRCLAWLLAKARPLVGQRLVLRLCAQAAERAAGAHATFQHCLHAPGRGAGAAACAHMSERRRRHAYSLEAWVQTA